MAEFAQGKVDPTEAGKQGGHTSGGDGDSGNSSSGRGKGRKSHAPFTKQTQS